MALLSMPKKAGSRQCWGRMLGEGGGKRSKRVFKAGEQLTGSTLTCLNYVSVAL